MTRDGVDAELLALPAPPMGRRVGTLALMALVVVLAMGLALSLRHDVSYFFAPATVTDLGDIQRLDPGHLSTNTFVRVSGMPTAASAVRYRRVVTGESYEVFPLAGQRAVFVHVSASAALAGRTEFSGRLVTFGQLGGRMRPVREYFEQNMGMPVTAESFVLLADESPPSYWWSLFFVLLCVAIVAFDVYLVLRWFRPVARFGGDGSEGGGSDDLDGDFGDDDFGDDELDRA